MCGIAGYLDLWGRQRIDPEILTRMTRTLVHRGPDSEGYFATPDCGLGARRLRIIDLTTGDQPIYNEDHSIVLVCNGEIFNYRELREDLLARGHVFRSQTDIEVIVHLYEEHGIEVASLLNGQFAFALYDQPRRRLVLARDHFGVNPLHFTVVDGLLVFGSEIKAVLAHPSVPREIDLGGLDQILTWPGLVSPRTLFKGVESLGDGQMMLVENGVLTHRKYWDLDYPELPEDDTRPEEYYVEGLRECFLRSVRRRLQADVAVGVYLSGGLDSSLVARVMEEVSPQAHRHSFSIAFSEGEIDETKYQRQMASLLGTTHHEIRMDDETIAALLRDMVLHCECPVKESFNACAFALSRSVREAGVTVVLAGQGADELFGGYPGYRFDVLGPARRASADPLEEALEEEMRERAWGDRDLFYERSLVELQEVRTALYSPQVNAQFLDFDCLARTVVDPERLRGRSPVHQRSYLDFKLRLGEHLLSEHGDRMVMANSVEGRYPFLDIELVEFARRIPSRLKVNAMGEKYIVKRAAEPWVPQRIIEREKFGFRAPDSSMLLRSGGEWVHDLLSSDRIRRQGYFNVGVVDALKRRYAQAGFRLHPHLETDLLMVVLTFGLLIELFDLPSLN